MKLGNIEIGRTYEPFVIAEMSGNHNQSFERAIELVESAAVAGVHAVKLQTYTPDCITLDVHSGKFQIDDEQSPWNGKTLHQLYREASTPWEWHERIIKRANELGLICFSSPFSAEAVDFLEGLDVPAYKIASFENTHLPLLRRVAETGKPIIISSGLASIAELDESLRAVQDAGCENYMLLKCTSNYPASPGGSNVLTIPHMRQAFGCEVGLSDHTLGIGVAVAAVAHGATVIEKHLTLRRADGGVDAVFSLEPDEMSQLVVETKNAWQALGEVFYGPSEEEDSSLVFRRSLYIAENVLVGDVLTEKNLRIVRPGLGLAPKYYDVLLGRKVNRNLGKGAAVTWDVID